MRDEFVLVEPARTARGSRWGALLLAFLAIHAVQLVAIAVHEAGHLFVGTVLLGRSVEGVSIGPAWGAVLFSGPNRIAQLLDLRSKLAGPLAPILLALVLRPLLRRASNLYLRTAIAIAPGIAVVNAGVPLLFDAALGSPSSDLVAAYLATHPNSHAGALRWWCFFLGTGIVLVGIAWSLRAWRHQGDAFRSSGIEIEPTRSGRPFLAGLSLVAIVGVALVGLHDVAGFLSALRGSRWPYILCEGVVSMLVVIACRVGATVVASPVIRRAVHVYSLLLLGFVFVGWATVGSTSGVHADASSPFMRLGAKADEAFRTKDFSTAASAYAEMVSRDPRQSYLQMRLGISLFLSGKPEEAEKPLVTVLTNDIDPGAKYLVPRAEYWLGRIELKRGNQVAACEHFKAATKGGPQPEPDAESPLTLLPDCVR